jgi:hypothetical protein
MMRTTTIFVVLAALSAGAAWSMRPVDLPPPQFEDTGELLFPGFEDPSSAVSLDVQQWDKEGSQLSAFSVAFKDGMWVIPSHNDYPADATERMAKAAAGFIGVRKDLLRSDDAKDHAALGVLDPAGADGEGEQKGMRVTIRDASGTNLVDVIVGKKLDDKPGFRYVRTPDSSRVYASRMELDLSTDFIDWIEKDLLKIKRDEVVALTSNSYRVDEDSGKIEGHNPLRFEQRAGEGGAKPAWSLVQTAKGNNGEALGEGTAPLAELPKGKVVDESKVRQMISGLDNVKIVGVRPQPERLTQRALLKKGFFLSQDLKQLFGNEGQLGALTRDGVSFTLYFGEISYDTGLALSGGEGEASTESSAAEDDAKKAHRYMFVSVGYHPELDKSDQLPPPAEGEIRGEARAQLLRKRFDRWFYVVANSSFEQMHKGADDLFKDAP